MRTTQLTLSKTKIPHSKHTNRNTEIRKDNRFNTCIWQDHRTYGWVSYSEQRAGGPDTMPDVGLCVWSHPCALWHRLDLPPSLWDWGQPWTCHRTQPTSSWGLGVKSAPPLQCHIVYKPACLSKACSQWHVAWIKTGHRSAWTESLKGITIS